MEFEKIIEQYKAKENIYKILSVLYYVPQEELFETELLENLVNSVDSFSAQLTELAEECKTAFEKTELEDLKVDHAQLFVGPFELTAPPYGSIYLEGERKVMGETTLDVIKRYKEAGLDTDKRFKEPPDHISAELEFMYYLTFNLLEEIKVENSEAAKSYYQQQMEFLEEHLLKWKSDFAKAVVENAKTEAYQLLAQLTAQFLDYDYQKDSILEN